MKKFFAAAFLFLAFAGRCDAQIVLHRSDYQKGASARHSLLIIDKSGWELDAFGYNKPETLDLEFGRYVPVSKNLVAGGQVVYWPEGDKIFLLPHVFFHSNVEGVLLKTDLGYYQPLNGGPHIAFGNETSATVAVAPNWRAGLDANWAKVEGNKLRLNYGPTVRYHSGNTSFLVNALNKGRTRVEVGYSF